MSRNATAAIELSVDGYCTLSSILALIPHRALSGTSKPTRAQAIGMVRDVKYQIDGVLDVLGYTLPVVSTNYTSLRIVGRLNAYGAAAAIEGASYSSGNQERSGYAQALQEEFRLIWKTFEAGRMSLPGAPRQGSYIHRANEITPQAQFNQPSGSEVDPTFTKAMDF